VAAALGVLALGYTACSGGYLHHAGPLDLLRATTRLRESTVAGRGFKWIINQVGKQVRINDVVRRTLPASPPSRLRYNLDLPPGARFAFSCGIPPDRHERPAVEFIVKIARGGREEVVWSALLDPASRPQHRKWMPADVDLSRYAGRDVDVILETRGYEERGDDARAAFWAAPAVTVPSDSSPVVIIYLVDTLRPDHTGPYGYARDTTPELTAFARDAVVFENAIAHASWTKPSVASLMTSLLPGRHRAVQLRDPLDTGHVTLPEMLEAKGYATGAAIANSVIYLKGSNFEQGFDSFAGLHGPQNRPSKTVEAAHIVDAALAWLDARRGFPNFLYVHTMDPHVPYTPPPPFDRKYTPHPEPGHPAEDPRTDFKEPSDRERMIAQYDGEIAYGDVEFGRFVRGLKQRGLYDRALVIFLGDHGEEFQDHGKWLHGRSIFDELIHIPLIVKFPGGRHRGTRVRQQVQEVDILPTILEEQALPVPAPPAIVGLPLQGVVSGATPERPAVAEISHRGYVAHGMRTGKDKYVRRFSPEEDELYFDLVADPKELVNRLDANGERVRQLRGGVEAAMASNPYRHVLEFTGTSAYEIRLRTGGWIDGVEAVGLGLQENYEVQGNGRRLALRLRPRAGQPREVAFTVRPVGAPVWIEGTRDGRALRPADVFVAQEAQHPDAIPAKLPEIEGSPENENAPILRVFEPPATMQAGIYLWLRPIQGRQTIEINKENCESLRALGYVGNCGGADQR
jgi:arylsulfatase A-like enzyme